MSDEPRKILVVDDERDILDMLESLLVSEGFAVATAQGGEEALAMLDDTPALILLDLMMPGVDGHSVLERIRAREDDAARVPVIVLTARNDVADIGRTLDRGVDGFIVKPFDTEDLVRAIKGTLSGDPASFYANYAQVKGVTSRSGSGYQQGDRIVFLDLVETDPESDEILEALEREGVYLMSILHRGEEDSDRRQSAVLLTAESGIAFGDFLNALLQSGKVLITACHIYKDRLDLPHDLFSAGEYSLE